MRLTLAALLSALAFAGCGGDGSSSPAVDQTLLDEIAASTDCFELAGYQLGAEAIVEGGEGNAEAEEAARAYSEAASERAEEIGC